MREERYIIKLKRPKGISILDMQKYIEDAVRGWPIIDERFYDGVYCAVERERSRVAGAAKRG